MRRLQPALCLPKFAASWLPPPYHSARGDSCAATSITAVILCVVTGLVYACRTSGEQRLSNFLLWETAYTELYFAASYWPDFSEDEFQAAVDSYALRSRRFGRH
jgi:Putative undecaprenyl diphosphate synthase